MKKRLVRVVGVLGQALAGSALFVIASMAYLALCEDGAEITARVQAIETWWFRVSLAVSIIVGYPLYGWIRNLFLPSTILRVVAKNGLPPLADQKAFGSKQ